jgi:hypothetical protein
MLLQTMLWALLISATPSAAASQEAVRLATPNAPVQVGGTSLYRLDPASPLTLEIATQGRLRIRFVPFLNQGRPETYRLIVDQSERRFAVPIKAEPTATPVERGIVAGQPIPFALNVKAGERVTIKPDASPLGGGLIWDFVEAAPGAAPPESPAQMQRTPAQTAKPKSTASKSTSAGARATQSAQVKRIIVEPSAGYLFGFGNASGPHVEARAGYRLPVLNDGLLISAGAGWFFASGSVEDEDPLFSEPFVADWSLHTIPLSIQVDYEHPVGPVAVLAGAGFEAAPLFFSRDQHPESTIGAARRASMGWSFGPRVQLGASYAVGPGSLVLRARYSYVDFENPYSSYTGTLHGVSTTLGYRFAF